MLIIFRSTTPIVKLKLEIASTLMIWSVYPEWNENSFAHFCAVIYVSEELSCFFLDFTEEPLWLQILLMEYTGSFLLLAFSTSDLLKHNPKIGILLCFFITDSGSLYTSTN